MTKTGAILTIAIPMTLLLAGSGAYNYVQQKKIQKQKRLLYAAQDKQKRTENQATQTEQQLREDLTAAQAAITRQRSDLASAASELTTLRTTTSDAQAQLDAANQSARNSQAAAAEAQAKIQGANLQEGKIQMLEMEMAIYKKMGTPQQILAKLDELTRANATIAQQATRPTPRPAAPVELVAPSSPTPVAPVKFSNEVATILKYDPAYDFYVVSAGANNGLKKGDKFVIIRDQKTMGRIEITRAESALSIAVFDPAFTRPTRAFQKGDRVVDLNKP